MFNPLRGVEVKDGDKETAEKDRWFRGAFHSAGLLEELQLEPGAEVEVSSEPGSIRVRRAESGPPEDLVKFAQRFTKKYEEALRNLAQR